MNCPHSVLRELTDDQLLNEVKRLAARAGVATADLIASLAELDARKLYVGQGYASLFSYCTLALGYSEDAAYSRITAARAAARFPAILEQLATGDVTLTAVRLVAAHLTTENYQRVLEAARGKSKREVEEIAAQLQPRPDVRPLVRKVPAASLPIPRSATLHSNTFESPTPLTSTTVAVPASPVTAASSADDCGTSIVNRVPTGSLSEVLVAAGNRSSEAVRSQQQRAVVAPLAPERYKVQFTVSAETRDRLRRAQDLLRHSVPDGDLATIFDRALVVLLDQLERTKWAATKSSRRAGRREQGQQPRGIPQPHLTSSSDGKPAQSVAVSDVQQVPEQVPSRRAKQDSATHEQQRREPRCPARPSRRIPAGVKRSVWKRDGGRCAFVGTAGRCTERAFLEFHHLIPHADGGQATVENLELRCTAHHRLEGERWFGEAPPPHT